MNDPDVTDSDFVHSFKDGTKMIIPIHCFETKPPLKSSDNRSVIICVSFLEAHHRCELLKMRRILVIKEDINHFNQKITV